MRSYVFEKKEKGVFQLLKNCISEDHTRETLCHAYYNGKGAIYATTGYRLVKIESKRLSEKLGDNPGYFDVNGSVLIESDYTRDEPMQYERAIPSGEGEKFALPKNTKVKERYIDSFIYAAVCHYTNKTFNPELFNGMKEIEWMKIFHKGEMPEVKMEGSIVSPGYYVTFVAMALGVDFMDKSETLKKAV